MLNMLCYLIWTTYRLVFYSVVTVASFMGFVALIMNVWLGEFAIFLGMNILWIGYYYLWNLITFEITVDAFNYFVNKFPDEDYFTIPKIIERIK